MILTSLFAGFRNAVLTGLILVCTALAVVTMIQWNLLTKSKSDLRDLQIEIKNIRAAGALTNRLVKDNANLDNQLYVIGKDLQDAAGFDDPLSDDIRNILGRLRPETGSPRGTP